jgi:hypothetical protein
MYNEEAANIIFDIFLLIHFEKQTTIYYFRGEVATHYTTEVVQESWKLPMG